MHDVIPILLAHPPLLAAATGVVGAVATALLKPIGLAIARLILARSSNDRELRDEIAGLRSLVSVAATAPVDAAKRLEAGFENLRRDVFTAMAIRAVSTGQHQLVEPEYLALGPAPTHPTQEEPDEAAPRPVDREDTAPIVPAVE